MILIRKGMQGTVVGNVQQTLLEAHYGIPQIELGTLTFGEGTYDAVRSFQASHLGPDGKPLDEDGIVGENTLWALQHPGQLHEQNFYATGWLYYPELVKPSVAPALDYACSWIGACEEPDGSNDGPTVKIWTQPDFIGSPWCALFASAAFAQLPGGSPFGRLAATWAIYDWAVIRQRVLSASDPVEPGDILLILRGTHNDPSHRGHTMIACGIIDDGRIATVAGNESNAVRGGIRERSAVSAIIRPVP